MGLIAWIVLGAIAGWVASMIMNTNEQQGAVANIIVGVVGAVIGGFLFSLFGSSGVNGFNFYSLLVSLVGAVVLLAILKAMNVFQ